MLPVTGERYDIIPNSLKYYATSCATDGFGTRYWGNPYAISGDVNKENRPQYYLDIQHFSGFSGKCCMHFVLLIYVMLIRINHLLEFFRRAF